MTKILTPTNRRKESKHSLHGQFLPPQDVIFMHCSPLWMAIWYTAGFCQWLKSSSFSQWFVDVCCISPVEVVEHAQVIIPIQVS